MLDASTRSFSVMTRMWVATCPRCGFACAWNPRRARAAMRTWSRVRALNHRAGIAVSCGAGAGVFSCVTAAIAFETGAQIPQYHSSFSLFQDPVLMVLVFITAALATTSGMTFVPHRSCVVRLGFAWLVGALPFSFAMCTVSAFITAPDFNELNKTLDGARVGAFAVILTVPTLSFVMLCLVASPIHALSVRATTRRFRRIQRETMAQFHSVKHT